MEKAGSDDPSVLVGLSAPDDAGIYRISETSALVQTVDFFTPVVDDPYDWGAIAVANAVSDIYAMGGTPITGLNLVSWPKDLDPTALASVLEGGLDKSREVGLSIIGGHTVDDPEPKYGMAVTGLVDIDKIIKSSAARPGMHLILTKRIGTGVISTALKAGRAPEAMVAEATSSMKLLNKIAARVMSDHAVAAATDVTGFGLLGHLHNLLRLSGVSARLQASKVDLFEGAAELVEQGLISGGTRRNRNYFERWVTFNDAVDPTTQTLLFDAQTSGGMLMAVDPQRVEPVLAALSVAGVPAAAIGEVVNGDGNTIEVSV